MLIGLTGAAGSGKDTVCKMIQEWGLENRVTVERRAFADLLKLSAARIFCPDIGVEDAVSWCNEIKDEGVLRVSFPGGAKRITGREFLQRYGTESHRNVFGTDFWVGAALEGLAADYTVFTDVRFPNEAAAIRVLGGEIWLKQSHRQDVAENSHVSEIGLPDEQINLAVPADTLGRLSDWVHLEMDMLHYEHPLNPRRTA